MGRPKEIVTKTELAGVLGVSKARVSQYLKRGLSTMPDGRINREQALCWVRDNVGLRYCATPAGTPQRTAAGPASPVAPAPQDRGEYRLGADNGAVMTGYRICSVAVSAFATICAGDPFKAALDQDVMAYRFLPGGVAEGLMPRCCEMELAWGRQLGFAVIPEIIFAERFGSDAEHARRLFSRGSGLCESYQWPGQTYREGPGVFETGWRKGAAVVARRLCESVREYFLEFTSGRIPDEYCEVPTLWHVVYPISLFNLLLRGWCEDLIRRAQQMGLPPLPDLDFPGLFGSEAAAAREAHEEFLKGLLEE